MIHKQTARTYDKLITKYSKDRTGGTCYGIIVSFDVPEYVTGTGTGTYLVCNIISCIDKIFTSRPEQCTRNTMYPYHDCFVEIRDYHSTLCIRRNST